MEQQLRTKKKPQGDLVFALDIGTRTVVGVLGQLIDEKYRIIDYVSEPHTKRAMVDGQIEDIKQVAKIVSKVKSQLEERNGVQLVKASIAAAGRALKTVSVTASFDIEDKDIITEEMVASMEMETIQKAQAQLDSENKGRKTLFYCVGHNVVTYRLDDYKILSLEGHKGSRVEIDMVVAFLPGIVVEGLYSVMDLNRLEVASLTLEPIAAMNVIIPPEIRLINIALVDIGAGTSDIAIAKDGAIVSYAMATTAGDEITEEIIRTFFVDFNTAEQMKQQVGVMDEITFSDIFGFEHTIDRDELLEKMTPSVESLSKTICDSIVKINGSAPAAVFLVGGGSLTEGLPEQVAKDLDIDENHVAVGGYKFLKNVDTNGLQLGAEFITPIGIGVTAVTNRGYDFSVITINNEKIRIFDTKSLSVFELLNMAGYKSSEIMGHSGRNLSYTLNGNRVLVKGSGFVPAEIAVNGKAASLTTKVTQGDNVTLKPAVSGKNASQTLAEAVDYSRFAHGNVLIGGHSLPFGVKVLVNGKEQQPDYEIQPLDEIVTAGVLTLGDLMESLDGMEAEVTVNGEAVDESYLLKDGDRITLGGAPEAAKPQPVQPEPVEETSAQPIHAEPMKSVEEAQAQPVYNGQIKVEPLPPVESKQQEDAHGENLGMPIMVNLNGKALYLPQTDDRQPHKFLELMNYIEIDTSTPKSDIELTLNGKLANFGDTMNNGDSAVGRWKEL